MGHRKHSAPRHGSLGVRPRKRASRLVPRIRSWPEVELDKPILLAFAGYKAGMTHAFIIDDREESLTSGREIFVPVTIVEAPPMYAAAIRVYSYDPNTGLRSMAEAWKLPSSDTGLELHRRITGMNRADEKKLEKKLELIEGNLDKAADIRMVLATQPRLVGGLSKKTPDLLEARIGGKASIEEKYKYARSILGGFVEASSIFREGQFVDVIGVTKGKGFQGVVKRFGVKELPRWHKHRKGSRKIGSRGSREGTVSFAPQAGQMGFHRRTEYNKRILKIGSSGLEVTPKGGFINYGVVKGPYIMLQGSIMGPKKRLVVLRHPVRPPSWIPSSAPQITYISLESKQGV